MERLFKIKVTKIDFVTMIRASFLILLMVSCADSQIPPPPVSGSSGKLELSVNLKTEFQEVHSFGASDCWTTKFVGEWADINKRNKIADLLFSEDTMSNGNPEGIALSLWRFNIGAGSFEQGVNSNITDEWRREQCFQNQDLTYDWNKHIGQRWFLDAAKQRGVKYSLGFSISPPVHMTLNGKAFSDGGTALNIKSEMKDAFADFLVEVSDKMHFDYLSPVNEPQWNWGASNGYASQEGSPALNSDVKELAKSLSDKISAKGISTQIAVGEAGQLDFLYGRNNDGRGDLVTQFFSPSSVNYIGDLTNVKNVLSAHSYFTTCPDDNMISVRESVRSKVTSVNPSLQIWQSEFGILGDICGKYNGYPRNTGIDYGLYVAKVLHHDLTIANVTSWQWWLAMSPYDYSDALVYINAPDGSINPASSKNDGIVKDSKQLWAFGNFSRFVRPGMIRVAATITGKEEAIVAAGSIMVSAYKDVVSKKIVIVVINTTNEDANISLKDLEISGDKLDTYTTSSTKSLTRSTVKTSGIKVEKRAVTTFVGKYK